MKALLFASSLVFATPAFAKQVVLTGCQAKAYGCVNSPQGAYCEWRLGTKMSDIVVELTQDINNADQSYAGNYRASYDGYRINLDFKFIEGKPLAVTGWINAQNAFAESTGQTSFDVGLRHQVAGRGFSCPTIAVR